MYICGLDHIPPAPPNNQVISQLWSHTSVVKDRYPFLINYTLAQIHSCPNVTLYVVVVRALLLHFNPGPESTLLITKPLHLEYPQNLHLGVPTPMHNKHNADN